LDILTDAEVSGAFLEERVLCSLLAGTGLSLRERRGRGFLSLGWLSLRRERVSEHSDPISLNSKEKGISKQWLAAEGTASPAGVITEKQARHDR
jgi:hypothetical protein